MSLRSTLAPFRDWRFGLTLLLGVALVLSFVWDLTGQRSAGGGEGLSAPAPQSQYTKAPAIKDEQAPAIWSSTRTFSAQDNALAHFRKHGRDFGARSVDEYVRMADDFLHHPPAGTQTRRQKDGDIVRFHAETARFGVMTADGTPRTYFRLNPDIHGYPSNQAYFDAQ